MVEELVKQRNTEVECPMCKSKNLVATEFPIGRVSHYECEGCKAYFDTEIFNSWDANEHFYIGKLRNPDFWNFNNNTFEEGLIKMNEKAESGIKDYLGRYKMEEIKIKK